MSASHDIMHISARTCAFAHWCEYSLPCSYKRACLHIRMYVRADWNRDEGSLFTLQQKHMFRMSTYIQMCMGMRINIREHTFENAPMLARPFWRCMRKHMRKRMSTRACAWQGMCTRTLWHACAPPTHMRAQHSSFVYLCSNITN